MPPRAGPSKDGIVLWMLIFSKTLKFHISSTTTVDLDILNRQNDELYIDLAFQHSEILLSKRTCKLSKKCCFGVYQHTDS